MKTKTRTSSTDPTRRAPALKSARVTQSMPVTSSSTPPAASPPVAGPVRPSHAAITQRAHEIWMREGQPEGRAQAHWLQAERELLRAIS